MNRKISLSTQNNSQTTLKVRPTAALYIRVSTEDQARFGYSLTAQEETLTNYAKSMGYDIYKLYRDEGKSGKNLNRPAMQELLADAEHHKYAAVFIYKLDRFSRSIKDLILTMEKFKNWGVDFVSYQDRIETSSAIGKFNFQLISALAELERNVTSERTRFTMDAKARDGNFVSKPPIGYVFINKKLTIDLENAEKVNKMFETYLNTNISLTQLAKDNNFTTRGLIKLLQNKTYLGIVKFGNEYQGAHTPIIAQALFDAVQKKINKVSVKEDLINIFQHVEREWRPMIYLLDALNHDAIETTVIKIPELGPEDDYLIKLCSGRDTSPEHTLLKAQAYKYFLLLGHTSEQIKPEFKFADKIADVALVSDEKTILVECGMCNADKVFHYLDGNAVLIVVPYGSEDGYVYERSKTYDEYIKHRFEQLKNIMDTIEKENFLSERKKMEAVCRNLGISERHFSNKYGFWSRYYDSLRENKDTEN